MQRTESAFLSTVFFVFISFKNTYCGQKHCTVCKNSLHCCKGKRQPYYLTVLLAFTSSKICFGNKKLLSLTKYVPLLQRQSRHLLSTVFFVLLVPQICFVDKKHCTVCKNSLLFCVRQCTTKNEVCKKTIQSCNKDVAVMQLLIPFSRHPQRKTAILTFAPVSALLTGSVCANLWQVQPCATSFQ